jgi:hypothetical protein
MRLDANRVKRPPDDAPAAGGANDCAPAPAIPEPLPRAAMAVFAESVEPP